MGSLRVAGLAWAAAAAPEWGVHRRRCHCRGAPLARPRAAAASLGAGQLRVGTEHGWLWDCRGGGGGGVRDYAREMEVAVRVVQVACTLCQRVQDSLLRPGPDAPAAGGRVHAKLDRSPVTVAGLYCSASLPSVPPPLPRLHVLTPIISRFAMRIRSIRTALQYKIAGNGCRMSTWVSTLNLNNK